MASGDAVQQIKERLSIVDVVAPYVELHKAGKNYKGKSPFTNEKTPSFYVSPDKGMYYCFSSSQGGDIFTFVQSMEGVDFKGALQILADKAGVELVPEDPKKRSERDTGYAILEEATTFFQKQLQKNETAESYLKDRAVKGETIAKWRIGYAPGPPDGGWRELRSHLKEKKFTDEQIQNVGLIKRTEGGKEPYDVFRDRVIFPIFDTAGKVIAFSGRILSKDSDAPKYVNSPETEFFNKSDVLYGFDKAKQGIRQYDFSLIVEGQFDVVLAHQAGYSNTVAVSGTALTPHHVGLLQRLSNRVVLALDADRAGIAAASRSAELMLSRGMDLKVARLPQGEDPADIIKADPKRFKELIKDSTHVIEFLLAILKEEARDERTYKLRAREEILPYIVRMQNAVDAEHFVGVVANAIHTSVDAIHLEVSRLREELAHKPQAIKEIEAKSSVADPIQGEQASRREGLAAYLAIAAELLDGTMADSLSSALKEITGADARTLAEALSPEKRSELLFTIESHFDAENERAKKADLSGKVHELRMLTIRHELADEKERLYTAEREGDDTAAEEHLAAVTKLQHRLADASSAPELFNAQV